MARAVDPPRRRVGAGAGAGAGARSKLIIPAPSLSKSCKMASQQVGHAQKEQSDTATGVDTFLSLS
jgi:hypothetical protein